MKKLATILIMMMFFIDHNSYAWADTIVKPKNKVTYNLEAEYKNTFLISNREYETEHISSQDIKNNEPDYNTLLLSFIIPGLGQIAVGEKGWGYTFLGLYLAEVIFVLFSIVGIFLPNNEIGLTKGLNFLSNFNFLSNLLIAAYSFMGIYVLNLINIGVIAATH